jgi:hypothetical protein
MFIPNSPSPPRGIAVSVCVGLLKKSCSPVWKLKSYHIAKLALLFLALSLLLEAFHDAVFLFEFFSGFGLVHNSQWKAFSAHRTRQCATSHGFARFRGTFWGNHRISMLGG